MVVMVMMLTGTQPTMTEGSECSPFTMKPDKTDSINYLNTHKSRMKDANHEFDRTLALCTWLYDNGSGDGVTRIRREEKD